MIRDRDYDLAMVTFAETLPVYFAFSEASNVVKIGFSSNVRQRLTNMLVETKFTGPMVLIGWLPGGPALEAELHDRFAATRVHGEWFRPSSDMADFIDEECLTDEPPIVFSEYRVSARGYWAARSRLARTAPVSRTVYEFEDGRTFRTIEQAAYTPAPIVPSLPETDGPMAPRPTLAVPPASVGHPSLSSN